MLTATTRQHLAAFTCPHCSEPLGRFHAYPITDPATLLSRLTQAGPGHLECVQDHLEATAGLHAIYIVKAAPQAPSAALVRLHQEDPDSIHLRLFSADRILFRHVTLHDRSAIVRPADYAEIQSWCLPTIEAAATAAQTDDERTEITLSIALLHKHLPKPQLTD